MREFIGIFVKNETTGQIEHHEVFESTGVAPDALTSRIGSRLDELQQQYGYDGYDAYWEGFDSLDTFRNAYPDLKA